MDEGAESGELTLSPNSGRAPSLEMQPSDGALLLKDERRLRWREFGDPAGQPVIALHGLPGSSLLFAIAHEAAVDLGLRLIAMDRWGYGSTDPHPAPSLRRFSGDVAVLADHLQIAHFAVLGVSGGGPYAVAVAADLEDRVIALALAAPVGMTGEVEAAQMAAFHRFCFGAFARSRLLSRMVFAAFRRVVRVSPRTAVAIAMARVASPDRRILREGMQERFAAVMADSLGRGSKGPVIDMHLYAREWDVSPHEARAPSRLWIGEHDRNVPIAAARLLGSRLPNCEVIELPDAGHLWVAQNYATVLRWIAETKKGASAP